jgi:hypothetical protein
MFKFFPSYNNVNLEKLKISDVGEYSISKPYASQFILDVIKQYYSNTNDLIITDATANNGGDTIRFAMNFKLVNSIEKCKKEFDILKHNIGVYGFTNVKLHNDDFTKIIQSMNQDIIFIDAPWGGTDYKTNKCIDLYVNNINLIHIIKQLYNKKIFKLLILKVPKNYNFIDLFRWYDMRYDIHSIKNMNIIVIQRKI